MRLVSLPWDIPYQLPKGYKPVIGQGITLVKGTDIAVITSGPILLTAVVEVSRQLFKEEDVSVKVINLPWLNEVDRDWLTQAISGFAKVLVIDNHYNEGAQSDLIIRSIARKGLLNIDFYSMSVVDIPKSGTNQQILTNVKLDNTSIMQKIMDCVEI